MAELPDSGSASQSIRRNESVSGRLETAREAQLAGLFAFYDTIDGAIAGLLDTLVGGRFSDEVRALQRARNSSPSAGRAPPPPSRCTPRGRCSRPRKRSSFISKRRAPAIRSMLIACCT